MTDKNQHEGGEADTLIKSYPAKKIIPRRAICKSIQDIEDLHPLRKTVNCSHIGGCCNCLCGCCFKK